MRAFSTLALLALTGVFAVAQYTPPQKPPQSDMPPTQQDQSKAATSTGDVQGDIQAALQKEPTLASSNINVQVTGQNVELTGTVPNRDAKDTAEQIAKSHSGSMTVKNHLKVGEANPGTPK